jgi:hypothetical protein
MTEVEWNTWTDPKSMLQFLEGKASNRKFRLFAVACVRLVWERLPEEFRRSTEVCELYADGLASDQELDICRQNIVWNQFSIYDPKLCPNAYALACLCRCPTFKPAAVEKLRLTCAWHFGLNALRGKAPSVFPCIFDNPFRPVTLDPLWATSTAVRLAEAIYQDRAFDRMLILADALEDAGCTDPHILNHCRAGDQHFRGCWVVDSVLGRS